MKTNRNTVSKGVVIMFTMLPVLALADDVHCGPDLSNEIVDGNVLVASACTLDGTTVKGNVIVYAGGALSAINATIRGNIQADNADYVQLENTEVAGDMPAVVGNVQFDNLVGDLSYVRDATVNGSIQMNANRSRLEIQRTYVGSDVQAFDNTGGVLIEENVIDGNLQCKSNDPAPVGGGNQVAGNKEDQCENLAPEADDTGAASSGGAVNSVGASAESPGAKSSGGGAFSPAIVLILFVAGVLGRRRISERG